MQTSHRKNVERTDTYPGGKEPRHQPSPNSPWVHPSGTHRLAVHRDAASSTLSDPLQGSSTGILPALE
ncbi:hypothetical protein M0657_005978 [Pyricularia oryzae]|uniref:Uncharacterized protein n=1 Tax=Pyricularia oryzae TaxID=318829 RepID=A0A4P7NP44_PYROR|nr:hypothetical protein M0657_005978 [Pyricularia oryzae]KAI7926188.1 hypothetical protein M9X92_002933 [Pyricularia oryzae]QBZ64133.1 hypothetical protein PoMZ_05826 [Pyricularia oryzae]